MWEVWATMKGRARRTWRKKCPKRPRLVSQCLSLSSMNNGMDIHDPSDTSAPAFEPPQLIAKWDKLSPAQTADWWAKQMISFQATNIKFIYFLTSLLPSNPHPVSRRVLHLVKPAFSRQQWLKERKWPEREQNHKHRRNHELYFNYKSYHGSSDTPKQTIPSGQKRTRDCHKWQDSRRFWAHVALGGGLYLDLYTK
jgi:hypothetical protein